MAWYHPPIVFTLLWFYLVTFYAVISIPWLGATTPLGLANMIGFSLYIVYWLVWYFLALFTEPGPIPGVWKNPPYPEEDSHDESLKSMNSGASASCHDLGGPPELDDEPAPLGSASRIASDVKQYDPESPPRRSWPYCEKCQMYKPLRTHHCSRCKSCTVKMDHHCHWINNCVGYRNHKYFFMTVMVGWWGAVYMLGFGIVRAAVHPFTFDTAWDIAYVASVVLYAVLLVLQIFSLSVMYGFHLMLISRGMTNVEWACCKGKTTYCKYTKGPWQNWKDTMGANVLLWPIPYRFAVDQECDNHIPTELRELRVELVQLKCGQECPAGSPNSQRSLSVRNGIPLCILKLASTASESMALWVDKYRPKTLEELDYHVELSERLKRLAQTPDFGHLLFYGPSGAGKKTRIMAFLSELFGAGAQHLRADHKEFKLEGRSKKIELTMISSNYHIEINPSDAGIYDRQVVQQVIKEIAQSPPIDISAGVPEEKRQRFKVVVLQDVDNLTQDAQQALRRTMEKHVRVCRLIMCCESTSKVMSPLRSRCLCIRVPAPTHEEICNVATSVANKEGLEGVPQGLLMQIAHKSDRNLRKALLMFEAAKVKQFPFTPGQIVDMADWEEYILVIADLILREQTPKRLLLVRGKFYELLAHCIPAELLLKRLAFALISKVDMTLRPEVVKLAAFYEHRMRCGSKAIFHLEAFVAKFMSLFKSWSYKNTI